MKSFEEFPFSNKLLEEILFVHEELEELLRKEDSNKRSPFPEFFQPNEKKKTDIELL